MKNPPRTTTTIQGPSKTTKAILAVIALAALGAFMFGAAISINRAAQGEPGDGIISVGEWNTFITEQVHTIAQGEKLSPQAEKLLCDTAITMKIRKAQARQIAGYCSGATRLLDQ